MNIETLNKRLSERAISKLKAEVNEAAKPLSSLLRFAGKITLEKNNEKIITMEWVDIIKALKSQAVKSNSDKRVQLEIDTFLEKSESLSDEIAELRDRLE